MGARRRLVFCSYETLGASYLLLKAHLQLAARPGGSAARLAILGTHSMSSDTQTDGGVAAATSAAFRANMIMEIKIIRHRGREHSVIEAGAGVMSCVYRR